MNDGLTCLSVNKGECTPLVINRWSTYQCFTWVIRLDVRHISSVFLTAFRRVRKISYSDYLLRGVCPSVHMEFGSHWMDFHEIWYAYFSKICRGFSSFIIICQENRVLCMKTYEHVWYIAQFYLKWEMFQKIAVAKFKTHILCPITFFTPENRAVYEIMWKYMAEQDRAQMTIWRMRYACSIIMAADTHWKYVIL